MLIFNGQVRYERSGHFIHMDERLFIFTGLGVDDSVFQNLDFGSYQPEFIQWIRPLPNETISAYAKRITQQIDHPFPKLIGLSFGGLMAIEVAKIIRAEKIILLSSSKTKDEIPPYYHWVARLHLHKLVPPKMLTASNAFINWLFSTSGTFDKQVLKKIQQQADPVFLQWAIDVVVNWSNEFIPENTYHIHGTADRLLPYRYVDCDFTIDKGGHLMVLNRAEEVTGLIMQILSDKK